MNGIKPLQYLKEMRLNHNKLSVLDPNIFVKNTLLEILDLSNNPIQLSDQQTLGAFKKLEKLKVCIVLSRIQDLFLEFCLFILGTLSPKYSNKNFTRWNVTWSQMA